jgi:hypothetical protein
VLKTSNSYRVKFRALYEMMICYCARALTDLISRYVALKVPFEQVHYQQSLCAAPMAEMGQVKPNEDPEKNHSPNDATEGVAVHKSRSHLVGLVAIRGVVG